MPELCQSRWNKQRIRPLRFRTSANDAQRSAISERLFQAYLRYSCTCFSLHWGSQFTGWDAPKGVPKLLWNVEWKTPPQNSTTAATLLRRLQTWGSALSSFDVNNKNRRKVGDEYEIRCQTKTETTLRTLIKTFTRVPFKEASKTLPRTPSPEAAWDYGIHCQ